MGSEEWNRSYLRQLAPYLVLSIVLHLIGIGLGTGFAALFGGGRGIEVQLFEPGEDLVGSAPEPLVGGFFSPERMKIFRVDFFREVIPYSPPEPAVEEAEIEEEVVQETPEAPQQEEVEEELSPEPPQGVTEEPSQPEEMETGEAVGVKEGDETEEPIELEIAPVEEVHPPTETIPLPPSASGPGIVVPGESGPLVAQPELPGRIRWSEEMPDALGIFRESTGETNEPKAFPMPGWELTDIDGVDWGLDQFLGNYTIYLIGDMSRRHGLEDLLAWNYVLRQLITNPQAAYPPNVAMVVTTIENPYAYRDLRVTATLERAREDETIFGVPLMDREGKIAHALGYAELPQPIVVFADDAGYIRMLLIGRIRDISSRNIDAAMDVIADMWQWTEQERAVLPPIVALLIGVLRDTAYDNEARVAPIPEIAHDIAPSWGYPRPPEEEDSASGNAQ